MKKQSLVWVGISVIVLSVLCSITLSFTNADPWSSYTHTWGIPKAVIQNKQKKTTPEKDTIPVCRTPR